MIDEHKLIREEQAGASAANALREVETAFVEVRNDLAKAWAATEARDDKGREKLWLATTLLTQVEKVLRTRVMNGMIAAKELEKLKQAGEPKRFFPNLKLV